MMNTYSCAKRSESVHPKIPPVESTKSSDRAADPCVGASSKKQSMSEEWAYELAKRYEEAGMTAECLEECDDLILWFSEGKYVYKAMELKMQYKPLTPSQQQNMITDMRSLPRRRKRCLIC